MKNRKIIGGVVAGALLLTAITTGMRSFVAKADSLANGRVAWYTFDDETITNRVEGGSKAAAIVTGLGNYTDKLAFGTDRTQKADSKAIKLGEYGLALNEKNLGQSYSISMWLKPDGKLSGNSNVLFMGYHEPEQWMSIAGLDGSSTGKLWGNGAAEGYSSLSWKQYGTFAVAANQWHHLVVNDDGTNMIVYVDGKKAASGATNGALMGENQNIYVGVNFWDAEFSGYVDDVMVFNRVLTDGEIERIYTDTTPEDLLREEGVQVDDIKLAEGKSKASHVTVSSSAQEEVGFRMTYQVADTKVARVDKNGIVTAVNSGETTLTVKATLGNTTVSGTSVIKVVNMTDAMIASYTFDDGSLVNQMDATDSATAIVTQLQDYDGELTFAEGRDGKGQAIRLGEYGLDLNKKNIGDDFTVSVWLKPDGDLPSNSAILFLGYDKPELWYALAGAGSHKAKVWARDTVHGTGYAWEVFHTVEMTPESWHNIVFTGNATEMCAYLDGMLVASAPTEYPLSGNQQNIYVGVNAWDAEFMGLADDIAVYDLCLSEEQIQEANLEAFNALLQTSLEQAIQEENLLGNNESLQQVAYDLTLPTNVLGNPIVWRSSEEKLLASNGSIVQAAADDTQVTLSASVTYGKMTAKKTIQLTLKALDRAALDDLLAKAQATDTTGKSEVSVTRLQNAIQEAKEAKTCQEVETAFGRLQKALRSLGTSEIYENPFVYITEPEFEVEVKKGENMTLLELPAEIEASVEVSYVSEDEKTVTYEDGVITGRGQGDTIVTAIVTARHDGWKMEYATAVSVTDDKEAGKQETVITDDKTENSNDATASPEKKTSKKKKSSKTNRVNANGTKVIADDATALSNVAVPMIDDAHKTVLMEQLAMKKLHITSIGSIYTQLSDGSIIFIDGSAYTGDDVLILVPSTILTKDGRMISADNRWLATAEDGLITLTMDGKLHTVVNTQTAPAFSKTQADAISYGKTPYVMVDEIKEVQIQSTQKLSDTAIIQENGAGLTREVQTMQKKTGMNWFAWAAIIAVCAMTAVFFSGREKKKN